MIGSWLKWLSSLSVTGSARSSDVASSGFSKEIMAVIADMMI
jgi:hypothetical protein